MGFREDNPALFRAVNALKAKSFLYERGADRDNYECILAQRNDVNDILAYDNCELRVNADLGVAKIHFMDVDDGGEQNLLKARFTTNEMKVFLACLKLYNEKYVANGAYIDTDLNEIVACMKDLGLSLTFYGVRKTGKGSIADILRRFRRYGMMDYKDADHSVILKPGITMAMDLKEFQAAYDDLFATYGNKEEETEKADEEEEDET